MKRLIVLLILITVVVISGCVGQTTTPTTTTIYTTTTLSKLGMDDFSFSGSGWEGSYTCYTGAYGTPYIDISCPKYSYSEVLGCEVYVNEKKSYYPETHPGLQICNGQTRIYLIEEQIETPEGFVGHATRLNKNVEGRVCCSHLDKDGNFLKEYEYCHTRTIPAYC